jgi:serine protease inhibitor ecotin
MILPRQARDTHRDCSKKSGGFLHTGLGEKMVLDYNSKMPAIAKRFSAAGFAIQHVPL